MEGEEERAERKVWSDCILCKGNYSEDIRMNGECLHSYCKECIEKKAKLSQVCPVCQKPLPSPLSSLPKNYSLIYWCSLSPPPPPSNDKTTSKTNIKIDLFQLNNNNNINTNYKRIKLEEGEECSVSPFSHSNINNNQQKCEECEESKAEYHCQDCKSFLCSSCSKQLHSHKIMKGHSILEYSLENKAIQKGFINYFKCDIHNQKIKELYCEKCNECICANCIVDNHRQHPAITVINKVQQIKAVWINQINEISNQQSQYLNSKEGDLSKQLKNINKEINQLENKLLLLKEKKNPLVDLMKDIEDSKKNINLSSLFLTSFIQSLPSLPLSSFISLNNNNNIIMKDTMKKSGIRDFFEKEQLKYLFASLISKSTQIHLPLSPIITLTYPIPHPQAGIQNAAEGMYIFVILIS